MDVTYPYNYINYNTLVGPSTFTQTCYPGNCANTPFNINRYNMNYSLQNFKFNIPLLGMKIDDYTINNNLGIKEVPILNSSINKTVRSYMYYHK